MFCRTDGSRLDHKEAEEEFKETWFRASLRGCKLQRPALPARLDSEGIEKFLVEHEEKGSCENYLYLLPEPQLVAPVPRRLRAQRRG